MAGPEAPLLSCLASPSEKLTVGLADNEGLIFSVKIRKGNMSWGGDGNTSSAQGGETSSSGEMNT